MRSRRAYRILAALTAALVCGVSCSKQKGVEESASTGPWQAEVQTRRAQIEKVKADNRAGFESMDAGSLGNATLEMIPYVVFRVLQETQPATFGDDALNASGFFRVRICRAVITASSGPIPSRRTVHFNCVT